VVADFKSIYGFLLTIVNIYFHKVQSRGLLAAFNSNEYQQQSAVNYGIRILLTSELDIGYWKTLRFYTRFHSIRLMSRHWTSIL